VCGDARAASVVRALDVWDQVEVREQPAGRRSHTPRGTPTTQPESAPAHFDVSGDGESSLELTTSKGTVLTGYALFARVIRDLRILRLMAWLAWVPGVATFGKAWFPGTKSRQAALQRRELTAAG
jgi:hypothetical protein